MFRKLLNRITTPVTPATIPSISTTGTYTINVPATTTIPQNYSYSSIGAGGSAGCVTIANTAAAAPNQASWITANTGMIGSVIAGGAGGMGGSIFTMTPPTNIVTFSKPSTNQEIVKLNVDGSVTWANGIDVDAAAEAFGQSLQIGAELRAGITKTVKLKMRDSVFEDLINIAKEKGSLTAEDLTYLLEASKIVEKLKGGN
jgi:hypothetical protein